VDDSGSRLFLGGQYYYRHTGPLCLSLCVAQVITDAGWREYLEGTLEISRKLGGPPRVGVVAFKGTHPNAGQRRLTTDFLAREKIRPLERLAMLTDSELLRGAMVAFGWAMPKTRMSAFKGSDAAGAIRWLKEVAEFDDKRATDIWRDAHVQLGLVPSASMRPPGSRRGAT
jgi:hypothetical protein